MQASKKIPLEDPYVLNIVRAVYILSNVLIVAIHFYVQSKINAKKGESRASLETFKTFGIDLHRLDHTEVRRAGRNGEH